VTIEHETLDSQNCRCTHRLLTTDVGHGVTGGFAVGQINEQHAKSLRGELGRGAAHGDLEIVRVRTECEDVVRHRLPALGAVLLRAEMTTRAGT
jgi:hypothetical protein